MKEFLIFRTDRVGDFLFSLLLIKTIKINFPNSRITLISSEKNHLYAKTFKSIEKIIVLKNDFISKLKIIFRLRSDKYDAIIIHDGKNRSKFISYFLKAKLKITCVTNLIDTQIDIIKKVCDKTRMKFDEKSLNFLDERKYPSLKIPFDNYIHLHFDEKWIYKDYIDKYINIEPSKEELINFISKITSKNKKLIITTGKKVPILLDQIKFEIDTSRVIIFKDQELLELENIVIHSDLLITCHGWITHIASAKQVKQIDIIDSSYPYDKWTCHLRNYNSINRKKFDNLSKEIVDLIE